ncbi:GDSL-type esterase/lipase family protein [Iamia majanohamensis]|uniref:GDSL-type esterase/lipase family protein n=1 Tax=Iamia majanohamensis TaxID=467976 RepID=A0AAF0BSR4_9ACTN|nr:GDSL-type esterase/lipase family protein [Iamia majanohamensis]WCO68751.1 GDSL-type esterase/lipase family protein [Iamia majanohamensis]
MAAERRNGFLTVVVVALVVVAAVAVGVVLRSRDPARGPQVLAVGDSVTYMSANPIKDAFDWTDNVDVQGRPGYRTDQLVPIALEFVDADDPEVLVVFTGYNDLTQGVDTSQAVEQMMDVAAAQPCAVWLLVPTKGDYAPDAAEAFNSRVVALAEDRGSVHLSTDWRDAVDATDGPDPDPALVSEDHIHPVADGEVRLAQAMEEAASRECR